MCLIFWVVFYLLVWIVANTEERGKKSGMVRYEKHTGISCRIFFHSNIIQHINVSWVPKDAHFYFIILLIISNFLKKNWQFFTFEHGCNFCSENSVEKRKELSFTWQKPLKRILVNLPVWNVRALVALLSGGHLDIKSC